MGRITADEVSAALAADADKVSGVTPRYNVVAYRLSYWTEDKNGALTKASGLVAVPEGSGAAPVLSYQHATTFTNANAPSLNLQPNEPPVALASQGYIVVASDYVGFALSQGQDHPYLQSRPTARAVIDMLTAAQAWRSTQGVTDTGKLYLVGYSEGGYATMAAQRELTRSQSPLLGQLVAAFPGAGPYNVEITLDTLLDRVHDEIPALAWPLDPDRLSQLGEPVRNEVRRLLLRAMVPGDADVDYQTKFLDDYIANDRAALRTDSDVDWGWTPTVPVYLFHGKGDQTVPYDVSTATLATLQASGGATVSLTTCTGTDAETGHLACVPEYVAWAVRTMGQTSGL